MNKYGMEPRTRALIVFVAITALVGILGIGALFLVGRQSYRVVEAPIVAPTTAALPAPRPPVAKKLTSEQLRQAVLTIAQRATLAHLAEDSQVQLDEASWAPPTIKEGDDGFMILGAVTFDGMSHTYTANATVDECEPVTELNVAERATLVQLMIDNQIVEPPGKPAAESKPSASPQPNTKKAPPISDETDTSEGSPTKPR